MHVCTSNKKYFNAKRLNKSAWNIDVSLARHIAKFFYVTWIYTLNMRQITHY